MTVRTQAALQTQIDTLLADNSNGDINGGDVQSVCNDLNDTIGDMLYLRPSASIQSSISTDLADNTTGKVLAADYSSIAERLNNLIHTNVLIKDSFTDPNGTILTAHTPDKDAAGGGWIKLTSWPAHEIDSNAAQKALTGDGEVLSAIECNESDCTIAATLTVADGSHNAAVLARITDDANMFMAYIRPLDDFIAIYERVANTWIVRASSTAYEWSYNTAYDVVIVMQGENIEATVNGKLLSYSSSNNLTATRHGIRTNDVSGKYSTVDDFAIWL